MYVLTSSSRIFNRHVCTPILQVDLYLDLSRSVQLFENIQIQSKLSTRNMGLHSKDTKHFPFVVCESFFFSISYSNFAMILKMWCNIRLSWVPCEHLKCFSLLSGMDYKPQSHPCAHPWHRENDTQQPLMSLLKLYIG